MKRYEAYKDSGVEWIGEVPSHWEVTKLKHVSKRIKTGSTPPTDNPEYFEEGNIDWFGPSDFQNSVLSNSKKKITKLAFEEGKAPLYEPNSVMLVGIGATVGKVGICKNYCSSNQQINAIELEKDKYIPTLLVNYLKAINDYIISEADSATLPIFNQTDTKNIPVPLPPLSEQEQIATYLDRKTGQLDSLIAQKRQLIALLEEERTALINQVVTKGLDPTAPLKPSGIDWLGDVPAHWEVKKLKYVVEKIGSGVTPKGGAEVYQETGIPLLRSQNIYSDRFKLDNVAYISEDVHKEMRGSQVQSGDVLLNITGGSIGRCFYVTDEFEEANVNQHVCIVRPNDKVITKFLHLLLTSVVGQTQILLCQVGGNREAVNFEQLGNFCFAMPNVEEQNALVNSLEYEFSRITHGQSIYQQQITLLEEYKTALISAVVTGKVDVRGE